MMLTYYHGGIPGLSVGDRLVPSPPHVTDGCPVCVARSEGRVMRVGEYRAWLRSMGQRGAQVLDMLKDADDYEPIDPPSARDAVYVTTDLGYATWYAARTGGDLYRVAPVGQLDASDEDPFPSWTCERATVAGIIQRGVRLDRRARRDLMRRWKKADATRDRMRGAA